MFIALFEPDIPQNTGTIIRLAACMGTPLHIIEPCGYPFDDKRMRRSMMDYYDLAHITRHNSWAAFLEFVSSPFSLREGAGGGRRLVLLTTHATTRYTDFTFTETDILLLGRESAGVPDYVRQNVDASIGIPMQPQARSLNVALAASMIVGEAVRQIGR